MTYLEEYHELIETGQVVAGYWIKKEIQNLVDDLDNPDYIYDTTEAHKRIKFMETMCLQSKAPYYGKPLVLMPFQKAFIEAMYSFKMADTKLRRFTEVLQEIARKNGKTTLSAGDGNADLFIGVGGSEICCASNDDRQARLIWREIAGMRSRLDPKKALTSQNLLEIRNDRKNIIISRMSSKTQNKDGGNYTKTYLDEAHDVDEEGGNCEIAEACWRGMSTKDDPIMIITTTQGFSRDGCYLDKKIAYAKKVIEGEVDDIHFLPFLYEQDSEAEIWQDKSSWEKSNPSLRYGVKKWAKLERDVEVARTDKEARIHLLCKDFNIKQNSAQAWLRAEDFNYAQEVKSLEDFRGCVALAGLDCSQTTDLTNLKLLFMKPGDNTKYVFSHYWIPESKLTDSDDKAAGARYKEWAQQGYITICPGSIIDLTKVTEYIIKLKEQYGIRIYKIGYDKAYAREFEKTIDELNPEMREAINQKIMSSPMKWLEKDLQKHVINFGNNPVDAWCLSNACCFIDGHENYSCKKSTASKRIDGAIVFIILYATLMRFNTEYQRYIK
ncbi:MAG: terminase large subunit [Bacteroidaceae bacterium]|nr:terminase large subunit [Bacteroidaceae bacterium]